jgi:hypothetical protein
MLLQEVMIEKVRAMCDRDERVVSALEVEQLARAYASTWDWGRELTGDLATRHALTLPEALLDKLDRRLAE